MGDIKNWCPMCGAEPGKRCTIISGDADAPTGTYRETPHFYRNNDQPIPVLVKDEPSYAR